MAKKEEANVCGCKCGITHPCKVCSIIILVIGVLFLLADITPIKWTLGINWWSVLFILIGCTGLCNLMSCKR